MYNYGSGFDSEAFEREEEAMYQAERDNLHDDYIELVERTKTLYATIDNDKRLADDDDKAGLLDSVELTAWDWDGFYWDENYEISYWLDKWSDELDELTAEYNALVS